MDWQWIDYAMEKNVLFSIDPDAHYLEGFNDIKYGVLAAQKGGLTKEQNLSSFSLSNLKNILQKLKNMNKGNLIYQRQSLHEMLFPSLSVFQTISFLLPVQQFLYTSQDPGLYRMIW